ncbi:MULTISPECIES: hypothetical protein [Pseudoalteromonas]|uniref:hypothetical protein n=1 Tax=Pseudoalteromonas TaxID=53246 RepID=UPI00057DD6FF|nr:MULTISPECIES: hypothetical protein [Pseudoalteromonas]KID36155.1 hypothetical protein QT15_11075 [Pseudoalteromonas flavipulchra NCIMB 2033 = ATCC BAA-314]MBD0780326.1 hypothetical protein [Pseudoalteromonas flavipulchra]MBE0371583.1 hypothetical protein [Pseudoalteromonas flavipulchra NCIMB 2033 = ATCC BAA-314]MDP4488979.1 hypothetical protein [Pseudoalteromonas piscicida]
MKLYFVCSDFFNYDDSIKKELEKVGYNVELISEYPFGGKLIKIFNRLFFGRLNFIFDAYYKKRLESLNEENIVFIIKGETLSSSILDEICSKTKRVIIYQWDALKNNCNSSRILKYSKLITTFDPSDSCKYGLKYKALFHQVESLDNNNYEYRDFVVSFVGTVHGDRLKEINKIETFLKSKGINFFFYKYYPSKFVFYIRKVIDTRLWGVDTKAVHFRPLDYSKYKEIIAKSQNVIDFPRKVQTGYTMRTIESLASNTKIITSADVIKEQYRVKGGGIYHLKEFNEIKFNEFLLSKNAYVFEEFDDLKLSNWLKDILK